MQQFDLPLNTDLFQDEVSNDVVSQKGSFSNLEVISSLPDLNATVGIYPAFGHVNLSLNDSSAYDEIDMDCYSGQNSIGTLLTMILYLLVCLIGLLGNTLVIYVVLRFSKMQTVTNIYILNLAVADESFLIGIPFLLYTMQIGSWQFGEYMCKAYMVSTSITQFTSSLFLLIMSADRYMAVCHPISSPRYRTPPVSKLVAGIAWLASAVLMLPVILFANIVQNGEHISCNIKWPEGHNTQSGTTFILYTLALGFATPLCFILCFYYLVIRKLHTAGPKNRSKEKRRSHRKVTKLVLTVITVYVMCWLPYWISQVVLINSSPSQCASRLEITVFLLVGCLGYSNSAMNPILYAFLSDNFKKSFLKACTCATRKDVNAQLQLDNSMLPRLGGGGCGGKEQRHGSVRLLQVKSKKKKIKGLSKNKLKLGTVTTTTVATTCEEFSTSGCPELAATSAYKTPSTASNATLLVVTSPHESPKGVEIRRASSVIVICEGQTDETREERVLHTDL